MKTATVKVRIKLKHDGIPNKKTLQAFHNSDSRKNLTRYKTLKDLFKKLGI